MYHTAAVRFVQRIGSLHPEPEHLIERQGALLKSLAKRFALDTFHGEIIDTVLMAHVIQHADVRMIKAETVFASRSKRCLRTGIR